MSESQPGLDSDIVRRFLSAPDDKQNFHEFFKVCYRHTLASLSYLSHRGWSLPLDRTDPGNALSNLAMDILGSFLRWERGLSFGVVLDYYHRHGFTDFENAEADDLFQHFQILLRGFVKQELHRLTRQKNPQIANLKRRINEVLKSDEFICAESSDDHLEYVSLAASSGNVESDLPVIPYEQLLAVAEETFPNSRTRVEWCRAILIRVVESGEFQNHVRKHELLAATVAVSAQHVELDGFRPASLPSPKDILISEAASRAQEAAVEHVESQVIPSFRDQRALSPENREKFVEAARRYLADFGNGAEIDSIPEYFREVMPEEEHGRYLKEYKYVFETVINKAEEEFKEQLKNDPTIRIIGGYS